MDTDAAMPARCSGPLPRSLPGSSFMNTWTKRPSWSTGVQRVDTMRLASVPHVYVGRLRSRGSVSTVSSLSGTTTRADALLSESLDAMYHTVSPVVARFHVEGS